MRVGCDETVKRDPITAAVAFTVALSFYFATSSIHLVGGDNPEFVTLFVSGGVAHPPGYPLYSILLRLSTWMPGGPVLGSSRVSAVIGALSVVALARACRAWRASTTASLVAAAFYALSPLAWRLATEAEVFALHALLASLILWVAAPGLAIVPERRVVLLAGLAGLGLANNPSIALLAPIGLLSTSRALLMSKRRLRVCLLAIVAFGAGLVPYLYCYMVGRSPQGRYVWGEPGTWRGLLRHMTRADFGTFSLAANDQAPRALSNVVLFFEQAASHTLVVPLMVGFLGFWRMFARSALPPTNAAAMKSGKHATLALLATWALAGPGFAALLNLGPEGLAAAVVERFRLLPEVVFTVGVAWGLDAWVGFRAGRTITIIVAVVIIGAVGALHSWPQVRAEHTKNLELYTENTEKSAPQHAVILGTGDYRLFSFMYFDATGLRPDLTYIDPHLVGYDWYRDRASRQLGARIPPGSSSAATVALIDLALALDRPVLITDIFLPEILQIFPSYPTGTLIRLLPRGARPPPPESVESENVRVFATFERSDIVTIDDEWAASVLPMYMRPWVALSRMFERQGDKERARVNMERAEEWRFLRKDLR
jgi:Protein of unknown function (DUF2723)